MDPSSKEECKRVAHESFQRSEGTGGDLSVLSTRREELSANSCSHNVIFVFRKLELSLENRGKKEVKGVHSFRSQHPPHSTHHGYQCCHPTMSLKSMLLKPPKQVCFLTRDFSYKSACCSRTLGTWKDPGSPPFIGKKKV